MASDASDLKNSSPVFVAGIAIAVAACVGGLWVSFHPHKVVYKASACHATATAEYVTGPRSMEHSIIPENHVTVSAPWQSDALTFHKGDPLSVVVTDYDCTNVHCELWVDGKQRRSKDGPTAVECGDEL